MAGPSGRRISGRCCCRPAGDPPCCP
jgi:hypothetical protein